MFWSVTESPAPISGCDVTVRVMPVRFVGYFSVLINSALCKCENMCVQDETRFQDEAIFICAMKSSHSITTLLAVFLMLIIRAA